MSKAHRALLEVRAVTRGKVGLGSQSLYEGPATAGFIQSAKKMELTEHQLKASPPLARRIPGTASLRKE